MKQTKYSTTRQYLESADWANYIEDPSNADFKVNAQQLAKNPIFLDCLKAPEGMKFVQLDFTALEPNILAEFSGCPTYREIYASGNRRKLHIVEQALINKGIPYEIKEGKLHVQTSG